MLITHVSHHDVTRLPPLLNTLAVCAAAGVSSQLVASYPVVHRHLLHGAEVWTPSRSAAGAGLHQQVALLAGASRARRNGAGFVIAHDARALPVAMLLAGVMRSQLVYHCHDFLPATGLRGKAFVAVERAITPFAIQVWVPTPHRRTIARQRGIASDVVVVRNCPPRLEDVPVSGELRRWLAQTGSRSLGTGSLVLRHGRIGRSHCIIETIEAFAGLPATVELVVIGDGDDDYIAECKRRALNPDLRGRVHFHPPVPHDLLMRLVPDGDVALAIYEPIDLNHADPAPNKLYESLACGVPCIVTAGTSTAEEVLSCSAVVAISHNSSSEIREAISRLLSGARDVHFSAARRAHLETFHYEHQLRETVLGQTLWSSSGKSSSSAVKRSATADRSL